MAVFGKKSEPVRPGRSTYTPVAEVDRSASHIGKTLWIKGQVSSDEEVIIEGNIEGKLKIKHRVVVGKNGVVNADIEAREVIIKGIVNGNVRGNYKVEIVPEGVLNGNILSQRVVLAEGAVFKGNIDMSTDEEPAAVTGDTAAEGSAQ